jgi:hypothetical protein
VVLGTGLVEGVSHFPNPDWQPVAQNAAVLPLRVDALQQSPNEEPRHVTPLPQLPSTETFWVGAGAALEVAVGTAVVGKIDEDDAAPQIPKAALQLVPQWSADFPHHP